MSILSISSRSSLPFSVLLLLQALPHPCHHWPQGQRCSSCVRLVLFSATGAKQIHGSRLLPKELAGLQPPNPCATIEMHKGCWTPPVHGLCQPPPAETTFYLYQTEEPAKSPGRFHYWLLEGQVTTIQPSVHPRRDRIRLSKARTPIISLSSGNDGRLP